MSTKIRKIIRKILPNKILDWRESFYQKETHINRALRRINGHTYVEIGVKNGDCFSQIKATRKIGIDPSPLPEHYQLSPNEDFFNVNSDDFFNQNADSLFKDTPIDVALVDGLHEFSQALRDILNLERYMSKNGIIFIHDCNPSQKELTTGQLGHWTGDVWKVAYYLRHYRNDRLFMTLYCDWGLGLFTSFGQKSKMISPTKEALSLCKNLDYTELSRNRKSILNLHPCWYSLIFFVLFPFFSKK